MTHGNLYVHLEAGEEGRVFELFRWKDKMFSHLKINYDGILYQSGLDAIELAAKEGEFGIRKALSENREELRLYYQRGEFIGEREDEHILWEQDQYLEVVYNQLSDALFELRGAFMITAYHYWEKSAQKWFLTYVSSESAKKKQGYADLSKIFPQLHSIQPTMPEEVHPALKSINWLVNVLKHASIDSWTKLQNQCPSELSSLIPLNRISERPPTSLKLSSEQLLWIFKVIKESGPIARPE